MCDSQGRPIILLLTEGQMSDHKGALLLLSALPNARELLGDKGYDSNRFRAALTERGITSCIPPRSNRKVQYHFASGKAPDVPALYSWFNRTG